MDSNDIAISRQPIKTYIKAFAARFKWGDQAYYQAINDNDAGFKKAIAAVR
jgi:carboxyl-terminal processing protease